MLQDSMRALQVMFLPLGPVDPPPAATRWQTIAYELGIWYLIVLLAIPTSSSMAVISSAPSLVGHGCQLRSPIT